MKHILAVLFVLLHFSTALAGDGFGGEVSYSLISGNLPSAPESQVSTQYLSTAEVNYRYKALEPYVRYETRMDKYNEGKSTFHPSSQWYEAGLRADYKAVFITARHVCFHPVDSAGVVHAWNQLTIGLRW